MSIATELQRLLSAKTEIKDAIEFKGVEVPDAAKLDDMPEYILKIGEEIGEVGPIFTSYIINLTPIAVELPNGSEVDYDTEKYKLPEDMIIGMSAKDQDEIVELDGQLVYKNVIRRIRANSHCYLSRFNSSTNTQQLWLLSDLDKSYLKDETTYIGGMIQEGDNIVMKLPRFWWKLETLDLTNYLIKVSFCMTESEIDNTWNEWDEKICIGVYRAGNFTGDILDPFYSIPEGTLVMEGTATEFSTNAKTQPFHSAIDFECNQIMMLLGFGWYSTTALGRWIGNARGEDVGMSEYLGMEDTTALENIWYLSGYYGYWATPFNNFWGLEDWCSLLNGSTREIMPDTIMNVRDDTTLGGLHDIIESGVVKFTQPRGDISTSMQDSYIYLVTELKVYNNKYLFPVGFSGELPIDRAYCTVSNFGELYIPAGADSLLVSMVRAGSVYEEAIHGSTLWCFTELGSSTYLTTRIIIKPDNTVTITMMN